MQRSLRAALPLALLFASTSLAAPLDKSATKKIDEAINVHYLATDFAQAESVLLGVIQACADRCSPSVKARAWMYVGIVRGSGRADLDGAKEAFRYALGVSPTVTLDLALTTDDTKAAFDEVKQSGGAAPPPEPVPAVGEAPSNSFAGSAFVAAPAAAPAANGAPPGASLCSFAHGSQMETRREIPLECRPTTNAAVAELRFKEFGSTEWVKARMTKTASGGYQATIPCTATEIVGRVLAYVLFADAQGQVVEKAGTEDNPLRWDVVASTTTPPPSFPGKPAPARCTAQVDCPPDMPGCATGAAATGKAWGDACSASTECEQGLLCLNNVCESAPTCESSADCSEGSCVNGTCQVGADAEKEEAGNKEFAHSWLGLQFGWDLAILPESRDVCWKPNQSEFNYTCTVGGEQQAGDYTSAEASNKMGQVPAGLYPATMRVGLSYDYLVSNYVSLGGRLGYAFGGVDKNATTGSEFLPYHVEARANFFLRDMAKGGVVPYFLLDAGMANVDATADTKIMRPSDGTSSVSAEATQRLGDFFAGGGFGLHIYATDNIAIQAQVNANVFFPAPIAFVITPWVGPVVGF